MHQPIEVRHDDEDDCDGDLLYDPSFPGRDKDGVLCDRYGFPTEDARCEECRRFTLSSLLRLLDGKRRCGVCMSFWKVDMKPKPTLRSANRRAKAVRQSTTLTDRQWEETVAHFNHLCAYCQSNPWTVVEHATPLPNGGTTVDNCLPACTACNVIKGSQSLEEVIDKPKPWFTGANRERLLLALAWLRSKGRA